jgi:hypothetical protein
MPCAVCIAKLSILRILELIAKLHLTFILRPLNLNIATDGRSYFNFKCPIPAPDWGQGFLFRPISYIQRDKSDPIGQ